MIEITSINLLCGTEILIYTRKLKAGYEIPYFYANRNVITVNKISPLVLTSCRWVKFTPGTQLLKRGAWLPKFSCLLLYSYQTGSKDHPAYSPTGIEDAICNNKILLHIWGKMIRLFSPYEYKELTLFFYLDLKYPRELGLLRGQSPEVNYTNRTTANFCG
jgi:hypothetical protein